MKEIILQHATAAVEALLEIQERDGKPVVEGNPCTVEALKAVELVLDQSLSNGDATLFQLFKASTPSLKLLNAFVLSSARVPGLASDLHKGRSVLMTAANRGSLTKVLQHTIEHAVQEGQFFSGSVLGDDSSRAQFLLLVEKLGKLPFSLKVTLDSVDYEPINAGLLLPASVADTSLHPVNHDQQHGTAPSTEMPEWRPNTQVDGKSSSTEDSSSQLSFHSHNSEVVENAWQDSVAQMASAATISMTASKRKKSKRSSKKKNKQPADITNAEEESAIRHSAPAFDNMPNPATSEDPIFIEEAPDQDLSSEITVSRIVSVHPIKNSSAGAECSQHQSFNATSAECLAKSELNYARSAMEETRPTDDLSGCRPESSSLVSSDTISAPKTMNQQESIEIEEQNTVDQNSLPRTAVLGHQNSSEEASSVSDVTVDHHLITDHQGNEQRSDHTMPTCNGESTSVYEASVATRPHDCDVSVTNLSLQSLHSSQTVCTQNTSEDHTNSHDQTIHNIHECESGRDTCIGSGNGEEHPAVVADTGPNEKRSVSSDLLSKLHDVLDADLVGCALCLLAGMDSSIANRIDAVSGTGISNCKILLRIWGQPSVDLFYTVNGSQTTSWGCSVLLSLDSANKGKAADVVMSLDQGTFTAVCTGTLSWKGAVLSGQIICDRPLHVELVGSCQRGQASVLAVQIKDLLEPFKAGKGADFESIVLPDVSNEPLRSIERVSLDEGYTDSKLISHRRKSSVDSQVDNLCVSKAAMGEKSSSRNDSHSPSPSSATTENSPTSNEPDGAVGPEADNNDVDNPDCVMMSGEMLVNSDQCFVFLSEKDIVCVPCGDCGPVESKSESSQILLQDIQQVTPKPGTTSSFVVLAFLDAKHASQLKCDSKSTASSQDTWSSWVSSGAVGLVNSFAKPFAPKPDAGKSIQEVIFECDRPEQASQWALAIKSLSHALASRSASCHDNSDALRRLNLKDHPAPKATDESHLLKVCAGCDTELSRTSSMLGGWAAAPKGRWCHYTGRMYCPSCHKNDKRPIPAHLVSRLDSTPFPVCTIAAATIDGLADRPDLVLPRALAQQHIELGKSFLCRRVLMHMRDFVRTCPSKQKLLSCASPKFYLLWQEDTYSLNDLTALTNGSLLRTLQTILKRMENHILKDCQICKAKGFFCEICNSDQPFYSFQLMASAQCRRCKGFFHRKCFQQETKCPRCLRRGLLNK